MAEETTATSSPPAPHASLVSHSSDSSTEQNSNGPSDNLVDNSKDVEKALEPQEDDGDGVRARRVTSARITRVQSLSGRRAHENTFSHPLAHAKTAQDVLVDFEGPDDPYHPLNWPLRKKVVTTALYGLCTMGASFTSTIQSPIVDVISQDFQVGEEVSLLNISLILAGFGLGPMLWGPFSEIYGRKFAVLLPYFIGAMFTFGAGAAKDIQTLLITHFFLGIFCSAPITNTGGVMGDIWSPTQRATAIVFYAFAVVGGPVFGPIVGGALVVSGVSWRWTQFVAAIFMTTTWFLSITILDESYPPVLLKHKAMRLRIKTGNWALHAQHEEWDPSLKEMIIKFGIRPLRMLLTPICFFIALYASFVFGLLYGNLAAFPIVFEQERGWNALVGSLPFLGILVGMVLAGMINVLNQRFYYSRFVANGNKPVPEARLPPMMVGSVVFAGGCFVFGWTAARTIFWLAPVIGTVMIGFGFFTIFQSALNYLVDTFKVYSASAIAANTFLRSILALAFPLFINPMYSALGIGWATSVFGFFAVCLIPIPFLFYKYGPSIRKRGKFSAEMA